jgi:hypothetical protein
VDTEVAIPLVEMEALVEVRHLVPLVLEHQDKEMTEALHLALVTMVAAVVVALVLLV